MQTTPGASANVDGIAITADAKGNLFFGFDRDAPATSILTGLGADQTINVTSRTYRVSAVSGLARGDAVIDDWFDIDDPLTSEAAASGTRSGGAVLTPELKARVERETALKKAAFRSQSPETGFLEQWRMPVPGAVTSPWGAARTLDTAGLRIHYGVDLKAQDGESVVAPASGRIVLAEPDLYYEGGAVFIDHGQGLISVYLHLSSIDVRVGDRVTGGQTIAKAGHSGRTTGPHLCWRLKWRNRNLDPMLFVSAAK